ncbi:MAG: hypothetical protein HQK69_04060, partial [Desulfamplus sp.]|nr:hypothetical protein [Desulfamplus sp.]
PMIIKINESDTIIEKADPKIDELDSKMQLTSKILDTTIVDIDKALKQVPNNGIGWGLLKYLTPLEKGLYSQINKEQEPYPDINFNYLGEFEAYSKDMFKPASENTGSQVAKRAAIIHDLDINGAIVQEQLQIIWNYNTKRFAKERIHKMVNDFSNFLEKYL